jgi:hypothetical protein
MLRRECGLIAILTSSNFQCGIKYNQQEKGRSRLIPFLSILSNNSKPAADEYVDTMEQRDRDDLRTAVIFLERPGLSIRLINLIGYPIEGFIKALPRWIERMIENTATKAVGTAFYVALSAMEKRSRSKPFRLIHRAMVFASGAIGGFFGLPGLIVELPISTTLMLRSIADIARSEGEDLSSVDTHLACITVFALSGRSKSDNAAEIAYYSVRAALARALSEVGELIAQRGIAEEGTPIVIRMMANLASRFGVIVTDKMGAEMVPILGALGGASINYLFISHFQAVAQGHFIVRRLERKYGGEFVKKEYEKVLGELRDGGK